MTGQTWGANFKSGFSGNVRAENINNIDYVAPNLGTVNFSKIPDGGVNIPVGNKSDEGYGKEGYVTGITITMDDIIACLGDGKSGEVPGYQDGFLDARTAGKIGPKLEELIRWLVVEFFEPTDTTGVLNAHDVAEGALTYSDPIGDYMTVGDVLGLSLFGDMYKVKVYGVYKAGDTDISTINEAQFNAYFASYKSGYTASAGATYTLYRVEAIERDKDGKEIKTYPNKSYTDSVGIKAAEYNIDDILIWVVDKGNYKQSTTTEVSDSGFSKALYINFPIQALPVQVISIRMNAAGELTEIPTFCPRLSVQEKTVAVHQQRHRLHPPPPEVAVPDHVGRNVDGSKSIHRNH